MSAIKMLEVLQSRCFYGLVLLLKGNLPVAQVGLFQHVEHKAVEAMIDF